MKKYAWLVGVFVGAVFGSFGWGFFGVPAVCREYFKVDYSTVVNGLEPTIHTLAVSAATEAAKQACEQACAVCKPIAAQKTEAAPAEKAPAKTPTKAKAVRVNKARGVDGKPAGWPPKVGQDEKHTVLPWVEDLDGNRYWPPAPPAAKRRRLPPVYASEL